MASYDPMQDAAIPDEEAAPAPISPDVSPPISQGNMDEEANANIAMNAGQDNSGAPPVMPMDPQAPGYDNSGGAPVMGQQPQQEGIPTDDGHYGPLAGVARGANELIKKYLLGTDPNIAAQAAAKQDPQLSGSAKNLLAIASEPDEQKRAAMVQSNRAAFIAKQHFAQVAAQGAEGKPADLAAAAKAATQAAEHVLDGSDAHFAMTSPGVVTATVKSMDGQTDHFNMNAQQFAKFVANPLVDYDKMNVPNGVRQMLANLTSKPVPGQQPAGAEGPAAPVQEAIPTTPTPATQPAKEPAKGGGVDPERAKNVPMSAFGEKEGELTPDGHKPWIPTRSGSYSTELENRALQMFPRVGDNQKRLEWMAAQQSATDTLKNKVDVEQVKKDAKTESKAIEGGTKKDVEVTKGENAVKTQQERNKGWAVASDAKKQAAMAKIAFDLKKLEASNANASQTRELKLIQTKIMAGQTDKLTPRELEVANHYADQAQEAAPVTRPGAASAPDLGAAAAPHAPTPGVQRAKFKDGKYYVKGPDGKAKLDANQNP